MTMLAYYIPMGDLKPDERLDYLAKVRKLVEVPDDVCEKESITHQIFIPTFETAARIEIIK